MDRLKVVRFLYFIWQVSKLRFQDINLKNWRMSNIIGNIWEESFHEILFWANYHTFLHDNDFQRLHDPERLPTWRIKKPQKSENLLIFCGENYYLI